jgi:carbon storage regulator
MLVITRKVDQSLIINGNIEIVVTGIAKDGVRLGIIAPREVEIHRREVFEAIAAANRAASAQTTLSQLSIQDAAALLRSQSPKVRMVRGVPTPPADKKRP